MSEIQPVAWIQSDHLNNLHRTWPALCRCGTEQAYPDWMPLYDASALDAKDAEIDELKKRKEKYTNRQRRNNILHAMCMKFVREKMPKAYEMFREEAERQYANQGYKPPSEHYRINSNVN